MSNIPPWTPAWKPTREECERLLCFEGSGSDNPDVIFVGLEEYCSKDYDKQCEGIYRRCKHPAFTAGHRVDKNAARKAMEGLGRLTVPVWDMMAAIMAAITGRPCYEEWEALGTCPSRGVLSTWLTELRPLPRPNGKVYRGTYIETWFKDYFADKMDYLQKSAHASGSRILATLRSNPAPQYAFFYGRPVTLWAKEQIVSPLLGAPFFGFDQNIEIGRTEHGTLVVLTGFYNDRRNPDTAFRMEHVRSLVTLLKKLNEGQV